MKFECKELTISDECLGCTVIFSSLVDSIDDYNEKDPYGLLKTETEDYLLLQRTYNEFGDEDFIYIELSNSEKTGELFDFNIKLRKDFFYIEWPLGKVEVELNIDNIEYEELKNAIQIITNNRGKFVVS